MDEPTTAQYTHGHHESVLRSHRWRTAENSAAYLLGALQPGLDLLDVGCGPGNITIDLASRVSPGRVVGIDAAATVVDAARTAATEQGVTGVEFEVADVYDLPFADGASTSSTRIRCCSTFPTRSRRCVRCAGCAGPTASSRRDGDYEAFTWYPRERRHRAVARHVPHRRGNRGEPDAGRRLLGWAHAAGFSDVTPSASAWCFATPATIARGGVGSGPTG